MGIYTASFSTQHTLTTGAPRTHTDKDMKVQAVVFVWLVMYVSGPCWAHVGGQTPQELNPHVYCGRTLARALALLCYDDAPDKRADTHTMYGTMVSPYYGKGAEGREAWGWMPPYRALGVGAQRNKRLVVSECCDKPCSLNELLSYC